MKIIHSYNNTTYIAGLSVSAFASWLKVSYSGSVPTDLQLAYDAAVSYVEKVSWTQLSEKTIVFIAQEWGNYEFEVPVAGRLGATISCAYYNTSNVETALTISDSWLESRDMFDGTLHVVAASYPELYDREDAIRISFVTIPRLASCPTELVMAIYMLGAYYYDCRTNDKEPVMTVVDKIVLGVRHKEF
jgi:hypothetical protein